MDDLKVKASQANLQDPGLAGLLVLKRETPRLPGEGGCRCINHTVG